MSVWELKCWPQFFDEVVRGTKRHELRRTDRAFAVGDQILLREYKPEAGEYTGREQSVRITYITSTESVCAFSPDALSPDYCILSIELITKPAPDVTGERAPLPNVIDMGTAKPDATMFDTYAALPEEDWAGLANDLRKELGLPADADRYQINLAIWNLKRASR